MIAVIDYDPGWPGRFELLREQYTVAFDAAGVPRAAIEHVGSTAVPGLAAKPIIDFDIVVVDEQVSAATQVLVVPASAAWTVTPAIGVASVEPS